MCQVLRCSKFPLAVPSRATVCRHSRFDPLSSAVAGCFRFPCRSALSLGKLAVPCAPSLRSALDAVRAGGFMPWLDDYVTIKFLCVKP